MYKAAFINVEQKKMQTKSAATIISFSQCGLKNTGRALEF
jgi:hypothetical protein